MARGTDYCIQYAMDVVIGGTPMNQDFPKTVYMVRFEKILKRRAIKETAHYYTFEIDCLDGSKHLTRDSKRSEYTNYFETLSQARSWLMGRIIRAKMSAQAKVDDCQKALVALEVLSEDQCKEYD